MQTFLSSMRATKNGEWNKYVQLTEQNKKDVKQCYTTVEVKKHSIGASYEGTYEYPTDIVSIALVDYQASDVENITS